MSVPNEIQHDLQVVIFDEGHNIEDVCRSSVGYEANQYQIMEAINNLEDVIKRDLECMDLMRIYNRTHDLPPVE